MLDFSLVIPTLNEAQNIRPLVQAISVACRKHNLSPEIIFVDDDSTDGTRAEIQDVKCSWPIHCIHREGVKGLTGAVVEGARAASTDIIVVMDADLSHPADCLNRLVQPVLESVADIVIGSRYISGGRIEGWNKTRHLGSIIASRLAKLFTSVKDPLSGLFCTRREKILAIREGDQGFKILLELLTSSNPSPRVVETPIIFTDRCHGKSKMDSTVLREYLGQIYRLSLKEQLLGKLISFLICGFLAASLDILFFSYRVSSGPGHHYAHLVGIFFGCSIAFVAWRLTGVNRAEPRWTSMALVFVGCTLYGALLRGSLMSLPLFTTKHLSLLAYSIYGLTSYLIWCLGGAVNFLFDEKDRSSANWKVVSTLLLIGGVLLHFAYMGKIELLQEEAYYWNYSVHPAASYLDHPPAVAWLIRLGTFLFGTNEFGVRFGALLCWGVTGSFAYRLSKEFFDRRTGFLSMLLVSLLPIYFGTGLFSTPDAPLICSWAALLYYLYIALLKGKGSAWYGVGFWLGMGLLSKYTIVFLGPGILGFMLIDKTSRQWFFKPQPWLALLIALCLFSPVLWWNSQHGWASFLFQSQGRLLAETTFTTHKLLLSILLLLTPMGVFTLCRLLSTHGEITSQLKAGQEEKRKGLFSVLMALSPFTIILVFSFTKEVKLNWTGPLWLALLPFFAHSMLSPAGGSERKLQQAWTATLATLLLLYAGFFNYLSFGWPGKTFPTSVFLTGFDNFSTSITKLDEEETRPNHQPPIIVGMDLYKISSGLAFYNVKKAESEEDTPRIEVTGRHLVGGNSLMYKYWLAPYRAVGRDLLLVCKKREWLARSSYVHYGSQLEPIRAIKYQKSGNAAGTYYTRVIRNYTPALNQALAVQ